MLVNLFTYIKNSLPVQLQRVRLIEFMRALLRQLEASFNRFHVSTPEWRYKINANASAISLKHHIRRELDVDVVITELNGKPVDLLVEVSGFVDENRLRALLDAYKLAGKSYTFKIGAVVYAVGWRDYACESVAVVYTASWSDYACELQQQQTINIFVYADRDEYTDNRILLRAEASRALPRSVSVYVRLYYNEPNNWFSDYTITVPQGGVREDLAVIQDNVSGRLRTRSGLDVTVWNNYKFEVIDVNR